MVRFTNDEKKDMYDVYIRSFRNVSRAVQTYNRLYPERHAPSSKSFYIISKNLSETGCVTKKRGRYQVRSTINEINVLAQININPESSSRDIALQCGITPSAVQKILKKHKYHDYKFNAVQKLHPGDLDRRLTFCRWFRREVNVNPQFYNNIIWTDETTFTNSGIFNRKNKHYYSVRNPHVTQEVRPQRRYSINLWCGIMGNRVIGPKFIEGNLNSERYLNLLNEIVYELPLEIFHNRTWFMQDGCAAHNARMVQEYLNQEFPQRWLGTNGPTPWPPRSPCLNPLDYFLWGYLKNKVYCTSTNNINELRQKIIGAFNEITPDMVARATEQMLARTQLCIENNGGHFQHLL